MNIFRYILFCSTLCLFGLSHATIPHESDFSIATKLGAKGQWFPSYDENFETEKVSVYAQYFENSHQIILFNFEVEKINEETGEQKTVWFHLSRRLYGRPQFFSQSQSLPGEPRARSRRAMLSKPESNYQRYDISLEGNLIHFTISDVFTNSEAVRDSFTIDATEQINGTRGSLLSPGEQVLRWKRYSVSTHGHKKNRAALAWLSTVPASTHPEVSKAPSSIATFQEAAVKYKEALIEMTDEQLAEVTIESVRTALEYEKIDANLIAKADELIADILAEVQLLVSTNWNFRVNKWHTQEDGSITAGTKENRLYTYSPDVQLLKRVSESDEYNFAWSYDAQNGIIKEGLGSWHAESIHQSKELALTYDGTKVIAYNPANSSDGQQWNYDASTTTWQNNLSHVTWSYDAETTMWKQTVFEADQKSSATCQWSYNDRDNTWTNITLGDQWRQDNTHTWVRVGGSTTPTSGFTESWSHTTNEVWQSNAHTTDVQLTASGCGAWTNQVSQLLWRWNTSADCARGIWTKGRNETLEMCTYDDVEQYWNNSGEKEFPPPLLPPFVVTIHNDIIAAHNSLNSQGIL